ncbi:noncompact myelin-associated protein isoform X2 [Phaenicophaeus curvirostris]|uniref:noncompact myelin-associated protein isoform X2 n=1 Tax=Phaenicophaeus curvirostris TaxID=33595 RepID=UPI0037F0CD44
MDFTGPCWVLESQGAGWVRRNPADSEGRNGAESGCSQTKMTTDTPLLYTTQFSENVTTKSQEQTLYQSSGAIVAAIVVGVIIIFTVVLLILKTYNRRMRVKRELEPKPTKPGMPPALGQHRNSMSPHPTVTFIPVDIHMQNR